MAEALAGQTPARAGAAGFSRRPGAASHNQDVGGWGRGTLSKGLFPGVSRETGG